MPEPEQAPPRTDAERRLLPAALHLSRSHDLSDPPGAAYRQALARSRAVHVERLVRGLLRGPPEGVPDPAVVPPEDLGEADLPRGVPRVDPASLGEALPNEAEAVGLVPLPATGRLLGASLPVVRGFGRHDVASPVVLAGTGGDLRSLRHPVAVVDRLADEGVGASGEQVGRVREEVAESVAQLALALLAEAIQAQEAPPEGLLEAQVSALPAADRVAALERRVTRGHPFHPAAKIRRGMDPADVLAYDPALAPRIPLRFVAVRDEAAKSVTAGKAGPTLTERLRRTFPGLEPALAEALPGGGDDHVVLPVHPWQYHHEIPHRYQEDVGDGRVVPIPGYAHPASPLLNLRTVVPHPTDGVGPRPPHCKLAIGVQVTNVERTLSPHAVHNGPRVTRLLRHAMDGTSLGTVGFLPEPAAASLDPPDGPHLEGEAFDRARHLAGLLRANPRNHVLVPPEAEVVPASSVVALAGDGHPLMADLLDRYAAAEGVSSRRQAALGFLEAHAEAVLPDHLRLLSGYGIALESHLQNTLLVVQDGRPEAVLVRDLGGIRLHHGRLADHGLAVDSYPDSDLDADGERDCHRKLYYTLLQNHLSEVVATLDRLTPADEAALWRTVADVAEEAFEALRADPTVPDDRIDRDEAALREDPCEYKAVTAMRFQGKRHAYEVSRVPNPLAGSLDPA